MVAIATTISTLLAAAALPATLGMSLRRLEAMEYQAVMSIPPPNCIIENGFDYVGNDISKAPGAVTTCCDQCATVSGCQAWSWNNDNGGTCYFKSAQGPIVVNAAVKSARFYRGNVGYCSLLADTDYVGNDIGSKPSADAGGCCSICQNFAACRAYVWTSQSGGTCYLKSGAGQKIYKAGAQAAEAYPTAYNNCPAPVSGVDYPGNDISNKPSSTADGCCALCTGVSGCVAYSWTNQNGGTCYLKSATGAAVGKVGVWSSQIFANPQCNIDYNVDYVGNDIGNVANGDFGNCCNFCRKTAGCKAWSWSNYNGGTCWLKSGKGATANNAGVHSGTL